LLVFVELKLSRCVSTFNKISAWSDKKWEFSPETPIIKLAHFCNVGDFYNGGLWGKYLSFVGSCWNFVSGCIKNIDTHHERFSYCQKKSLWQTYMKCTVALNIWKTHNSDICSLGYMCVSQMQCPPKCLLNCVELRVIPQPIGNASASVPIGKNLRRFLLNLEKNVLHLVNFIRNNWTFGI